MLIYRDEHDLDRTYRTLADVVAVPSVSRTTRCDAHRSSRWRWRAVDQQTDRAIADLRRLRTALFVRLAHEAADERRPDERGEADLRQVLTAYFRAAKSERDRSDDSGGLFVDLSPAQVVALGPVLVTTGRRGSASSSPT